MKKILVALFLVAAAAIAVTSVAPQSSYACNKQTGEGCG